MKVPAPLWAGIGLTVFGLVLLAVAGAMLRGRSRAQRRDTAATAVFAG